MSGTELLDRFVVESSTAESVAIGSLEPGTTLIVTTQRSQYRLVVLSQPGLVIVTGGDRFPESRVVRFDGATSGGSALVVGRIVVGLRMEVSLGPVRITSSPVRSISIEGQRSQPEDPIETASPKQDRNPTVPSRDRFRRSVI